MIWLVLSKLTGMVQILKLFNFLGFILFYLFIYLFKSQLIRLKIYMEIIEIKCQNVPDELNGILSALTSTTD